MKRHHKRQRVKKKFSVGLSVIFFVFLFAFTVIPIGHKLMAYQVEYERPDTFAKHGVAEKEKIQPWKYKNYAKQQARKHGVSWRWVKFLITCETAGTWNPNIQSRYIINGERERSFGLAQIYLDMNPSISKEQATNPYYAIDFIITETLKGHYGWRWVNCRQAYLNKYYQ